MLLAIDVGNTNIVLGVFEADSILARWRISTDSSRLADEYGPLMREQLRLEEIDHRTIDGTVISCVVPLLRDVMTQVSQRYFGLEPITISIDLDLGIPILVDQPAEVGADRLVNVIGAIAEHGGPLIVIDFGTAITFDAVSIDGAYLGGVIVPGIRISSEALFERAAQLAKVEIRRPERVIGKNTTEHVQAGIYYGFLGQMEEIVRQIKKALPGDPKVIATGGQSRLIAANSELVDIIDLDLTLKGLKVLYDRIQRKG